jgi:hypothetical protein
MNIIAYSSGLCCLAQVAQSVEQRTENPRVDGSIPPLGTTYSTFKNAQVAQSVEQRTENPRVDGSIPPLGTIFSVKSKLKKQKNYITSTTVIVYFICASNRYYVWL